MYRIKRTRTQMDQISMMKGKDRFCREIFCTSVLYQTPILCPENAFRNYSMDVSQYLYNSSRKAFSCCISSAVHIFLGIDFAFVTTATPRLAWILLPHPLPNPGQPPAICWTDLLDTSIKPRIIFYVSYCFSLFLSFGCYVVLLV